MSSSHNQVIESAQRQQKRRKLGSCRNSYKTSRFIFSSDDEEVEQTNHSPSHSSSHSETTERKFKEGDTVKSRLLPNQRKAFDNVKEDLNGRFNAAYAPEVGSDGFILESDTDLDSDEDYDKPSTIPWHNTLGQYAPKGQPPYPKSCKFGISDHVVLEKRIKKICKREKMSFEDFGVFTQKLAKDPKNKKIWRKIAKIFPDRTLYSIIKYCKGTYNPLKSYTNITATEYNDFKSAVELHGESPRLLSKELKLDPVRVQVLLSYYRNNKITKEETRWSEGDIKELLLYAKEHVTVNGNPDFVFISKKFNDGRTAYQCSNKYRLVEGLQAEDGSIRKAKDITHLEKLKYFEDLLAQAVQKNLRDESQLEFKKNMTGPLASVYGRKLFLKLRLQIEGVETMHVKDVLKKLIETEKKTIQYIS